MKKRLENSLLLIGVLCLWIWCISHPNVKIQAFGMAMLIFSLIGFLMLITRFGENK